MELSDKIEAHEAEYFEAFAEIEREFGARCYLITAAYPVQVLLRIKDGRTVYFRERDGWEAYWAVKARFTPDRFKVYWDQQIAEGDDYEDSPLGACNAASFLKIMRGLLPGFGYVKNGKWVTE